MQKKIIALAVAGLMSGAAFAQSNVEVYGVMGAYWNNAKVTSAAGVSTTTNLMNSGGQSGSRLGFRGTEDLGGGLKAVFAMETAINVDAPAASTLGSRQSWVGVQGGFGTVSFGRQYTPMFNALAIADVTGYADWSMVAVGGSAGNTGIQMNAAQARNSNSINYKGAFGPVSVQAMYGMGEDGNAGTKGNGDMLSFNAAYAAGPIAAGYVYAQWKTEGQAGVPNGNVKANGIVGSFDMGMAKLAGSMTWEKTTATTNSKTKTWQLGADVKLGAGNVLVSFGNRNPDGSNNDLKGWQLSYSHALSKRTNVVAGYAQFNPEGPADNKNIFAGLRHTF